MASDLLAGPVNCRLRLLDRELLAAAGEAPEPAFLCLRPGLRAFLRFPRGILPGIPPEILVVLDSTSLTSFMVIAL